MCQKTTSDQKITAVPQMTTVEQTVNEIGLTEHTFADLTGDKVKPGSMNDYVSTMIIPEHLKKTGKEEDKKTGADKDRSVKAENIEDEEEIVDGDADDDEIVEIDDDGYEIVDADNLDLESEEEDLWRS